MTTATTMKTNKGSRLNVTPITKSTIDCRSCGSGWQAITVRAQKTNSLSSPMPSLFNEQARIPLYWQMTCSFVRCLDNSVFCHIHREFVFQLLMCRYDSCVCVRPDMQYRVTPSIGICFIETCRSAMYSTIEGIAVDPLLRSKRFNYSSILYTQITCHQ